MEENKKVEKIDNFNPHKNKVHKVLAHSYFFSFILFLFSLFLDFIFPLKIFEDYSFSWFGILFLFFGTILVLWAQKSSLSIPKENMSKESFCRGPYRYMRSPTHFGLFLLIFGFGVVVNSFFIIFFALISFFITKFFFLKKEESILEQKYGVHYLEYKKTVKF